MKNHLPFKIGIMQGRLLPKINNQYQAFPIHNWYEEFYISQKIGLDLIEFIFDKGDLNLNPLFSKTGILEIEKIINTTGVGVQSICADYFMYNPLYKSNANNEIEILKKLISNASLLEIKDIVIPCVDNSSLNSQAKIKNFRDNILKVCDLAEKKNINLAIESDLNPINFIKLIKSINANKLTINYDTGNSAFMGYDNVEEIKLLNTKISSIHIKDRIFHGESVILGKGNFNFNSFFINLKEINFFPKYFIMQVYRDNEGVEIFKRQLNWFIKKLQIYFSDNL